MVAGLQAFHAASSPLLLVLTVDSLRFHAAITTVHEGTDYRLRPTVVRLRESIDTEEITVLQRIAGQKNVADALTKRNTTMYRSLNTIRTQALERRSNSTYQHA